MFFVLFQNKINYVKIVLKWKIIFFFFLYSDATKREKLCQLSPECDTVALELEVTVTCKQKAISKQAQAKQSSIYSQQVVHTYIQLRSYSSSSELLYRSAMTLPSAWFLESREEPSQRHTLALDKDELGQRPACNKETFQKTLIIGSFPGNLATKVLGYLKNIPYVVPSMTMTRYGNFLCLYFGKAFFLKML